MLLHWSYLKLEYMLMMDMHSGIQKIKFEQQTFEFHMIACKQSCNDYMIDNMYHAFK